MDTIGSRIRAEREAQEISRNELAKAAGIAATTLSNLELGLSKSSTALHKIARRLGVHVDWLETGKGKKRVTAGAVASVAEIETRPGYVRFDVFEGGAGMGIGVVNDDYPEVVQTIEVAEWEVRRKLGYLPRPGRIQLITGRGPSMRPKLEDGDIIWIDTSVDYFDGDDYYLINVGGETQIKMLQKRGDGLWVVSVNTDFPAYRPDADEVTILGKALIHAGLRKF
ncbi:transcriptional regulator [Stenotrophomonas sp. Betaine-02u-21]|uniref:XRE family transcriptional regulator n=1 Tax=unclassified Stenotrophomonas TaxID=196198 RepID=UPI000C336872|nr:MULTISPECIES: helix-turn-helix transcriptional regulator [unclassified Stenotrophomonas]PKH70304.1 transcriptional regulator [Stenotrophomonas sp. Betaine-02u-23]PKH75195.1 transcriptional regulator [Stenotrophomonas sp. Betaine-02u-21]PKH97618.1 transcriptional regulator [Stenotrophomonas sp. Bg11-02]